MAVRATIVLARRWKCCAIDMLVELASPAGLHVDKSCAWRSGRAVRQPKHDTVLGRIKDKPRGRACARSLTPPARDVVLKMSLRGTLNCTTACGASCRGHLHDDFRDGGPR
jgi:hypothetical protein